MSYQPAPSAAVIDLAREFRVVQQACDDYRVLLEEQASRLRDAAEGFIADMRSEGLQYGPQRMLCETLRPHFITARLEAYVEYVVTALVAAMHRLAEHARSDAEMQQALGVTHAEREFFEIDAGYPDLSALSRLDTFVSPEGLHLVEYNAECPTGVGYNQRLFRVFDRLPLLGSFALKNPLRKADGTDRVMQTLRTCWQAWGGQGTPTVGIVDWDNVVTRGEFEIFAEWFRAHDVPTIVVDPRALQLRNGKLYGAGERIDVVYRRLLTSEFIERRGECAVFEAAYCEQAACFVNNLRTKLLHKKLIFGLLWDARWQSLLSQEERRLVRCHVPWTQRLQKGKAEVDGESVDLFAYARANRDELVLKPNDDYGGKGLMLGSEASEPDWMAALERVAAGADDYVLQRRIPLYQAQFPDMEGKWKDHYVDLDPFFYRGEMFGYMSRMSTQRISNVTTGGGQMPTYVLLQE